MNFEERKRIDELLRKAGFKHPRIERISGAGSDRKFFRIISPQKTAVLMTGTGHGAALDDWLAIHGFLLHLGVGVPGVFAHDMDVPAILVEDLGGMPPPRIEDYPLIVGELARLAVVAGKEIGGCSTVANRPFDFDAFRWESRYFVERYIRTRSRLSNGKIIGLETAFDAIAHELASLPRLFCHRDFQSSNLTLDDRRVRIIDFQSAMLGPPEYDLASLLWDSRIELHEAMRAELIERYTSVISDLNFPISATAFKKKLTLVALSRTMQSLGAYCFLADIKGKSRFDKLIPPSERHLRKLIEETGRLTELLDILPEG